MKDALNYTTTRAMAAAALLKIGAAFTVAGTGGDVPWTWVGFLVAADLCVMAARALKGEPVDPGSEVAP